MSISHRHSSTELNYIKKSTQTGGSEWVFRRRIIDTREFVEMRGAGGDGSHVDVPGGRCRAGIIGDNRVRNFYSVSISGYHIAEAGANPISQLAFTLANGFTYVEYYLSRGMDINEFAPNLSFFFSNGIDPEYAVIGRVARRLWAKAMKNKYGANARSQMLKYHIQTSGRSLHAQEIDFNDIRTTLQALYAIYDNCNSLHTNAYDDSRSPAYRPASRLRESLCAGIVKSPNESM